MLLDLENIEKLFVERYNEKARANKAKAASATKAAELCMPKKGPEYVDRKKSNFQSKTTR